MKVVPTGLTTTDLATPAGAQDVDEPAGTKPVSQAESAPELPSVAATKLAREGGGAQAGSLARDVRKGPMFAALRWVEAPPPTRLEDILLLAIEGKLGEKFSPPLDKLEVTEIAGADRHACMPTGVLEGVAGPLTRIPGDKMSYVRGMRDGESKVEGWLQTKDGAVVNSGLLRSVEPHWHADLVSSS